MNKYKNILAETNFNLINIKIMKTKYIETINYIIDKFLMKDEGKINKYLSYIDFH